MATSSIHTRFFTLPFWVKFHLMLLFCADHNEWVTQVVRTCSSIIGKVYLLITNVVSSADAFKWVYYYSIMGILSFARKCSEFLCLGSFLPFLLLPYEMCGSLVVREKIKKVYPHSAMIDIYTQLKPYWRRAYHPVRCLFKLAFCERMVDTQASPKVFDRGKTCCRPRVMANYSKTIVVALVFKLGYSLKLLWKGSITFMLVQGVETGAVCKLLDKRLQKGTTLWATLILQLTSNHEVGTLLQLQYGVPSATGDTFCELWKRGAMKEQFLCCCCYPVFVLSTKYSQLRTFNTSTMYSRGSFQAHFHAAVKLSQIQPGGNLCLYRSFTQLLHALILNVLLLIGYLRWKFRLIPPGLWSVKYFRGNLFCEDEARNGLATSFLKSNLFSTSLWSTENGTSTIWIVIELPGAPGYLSSCLRLEFDKGVMANQVNTAVFENHKFDFGDNGKEGEVATNGYLQVANFVVRGVIVHHSKVCKHTNLESTEEFWILVVIFATILASPIEQPASHLEELFVDSHRQIAMFSGSTPRPMIAGVVFLLFLIYPAGSNDDKASVNPGELHIRRAGQTLLRKIQIQYLWIWIDYLKWKCKLSSTSLWRVGLKGMAATSERVVLGYWFNQYLEFCSRLQLKARDGAHWITSDEYIFGDVQHLWGQLNVSAPHGILIQEKEKVVSSIMSTNAFSRLLCSQLQKWSIDDSAVLSIRLLQVHCTDENTRIQIHVSTAYREGLPMLTESALSITQLFLKFVKGHNSYYVRQILLQCNAPTLPSYKTSFLFYFPSLRTRMFSRRLECRSVEGRGYQDVCR